MPTRDHRLLSALGLQRRELRAWVMYDWASAAFGTTVVAAVLPAYYSTVAAASLPEHMRTAWWGYTQTVALALIALLSPVLGAYADLRPAKKRLLLAFAGVGVLGAALLSFVGRGQWLLASTAFVVGYLGFAVSNVFYDALLPHLAAPEEIDRASATGYAAGFVGGGLLLALNLAWIALPETFGLADQAQASRLAFASVAIWWALFSLPLARWVNEPPVTGVAPPGPVLAAAFGRLAQSLRALRRRREAFVFLLAFCFYNNGINTMIKMAVIYGSEIGIAQGHLIGALLLVQLIGVPCTLGYGALAGRIGAQRGIYIALAGYTLISLLAYFIARPWHFWCLAGAVALVQGGCQSLSRSLFATLVPRRRSSEFFGLYSVAGKLGNLVGPLVFAVISQLAGGSRPSILALGFFFVVGAALLRLVDVERGRRLAAGAPVG